MNNLPVRGRFSVTAAYGETGALWQSGHKGIDLVADNKTVYCCCEGRVRVVANDPDGWGRYVSVGDGNGMRHIFCHLEEGSVAVKTGDTVKRGSVIGRMGKTGNVTGVHLHYQLNNASDMPTNPTAYLGIPNKRGSYDSTDYSVYADADSISEWARDAVQYVTDNGYMLGDGENFNPKGYLTREEMAVIIKRLTEE